MTELLPLYLDTRSRIVDLVRDATPDELDRTVPACPDWTVRQLLTHCVSMPAAIGAGDLPSDDLDAWIDAILTARRDRTIEELVDEWSTTDDTIATMVGGGGAVLLDDLVVHEHDLRGALGRPDRSRFEAEVFVPRALASCVPELERRELGAIEVHHDGRTWRSHDAEVGWVLETTPWEAVRALYSRRTADELRALGSTADDIEAYIALLDDHLPLPTATLGEN